MSFSLHYAERVRHMLLSAGTNGITQNYLHQKSRTPKYDIKDLLMLLEAWQKRRWVDKYPDPTNAKRTFYRPTELLVTQWPIITNVVDELVIGELPSLGSDPERAE